jgi:hypothetical protein
MTSDYSEKSKHDRKIHFTPDKYKLKQFKQCNYFRGELMNVHDFELQRNYVNEKRYLINRLIHGRGIVCGLNVNRIIKDFDTLRADISEGCAIDSCGREIIVSKRFECSVILPNPNVMLCDTFALYLRRADYLVDPVASPLHAAKGGQECYDSHIEEEFELFLDEIPDEQDNDDSYKDLSQTVIDTTDRGFERKKITEAYCRKLLEKCPSCEETHAGGPKVLLAVIRKDLNVDCDKTIKHRKIVCSNAKLCDLLTTHLCDLSNAHRVSPEQVGALRSINNIGNIIGQSYAQNVDIVSDDARIRITPDQQGRKISLSLADCPGTGTKVTSGLIEISRHTNEAKSSVYAISSPIEHCAGPCIPAVILGKMDANKQSVDYIDDLPAINTKYIRSTKSHKDKTPEWLASYLSKASYPVILRPIRISDSHFSIIALFHANSKEQTIAVEWTAISRGETRS